MFACGLLLLRNLCSSEGVCVPATTATMGRNSPHKVETVMGWGWGENQYKLGSVQSRLHRLLPRNPGNPGIDQWQALKL